MRFPKLQSENDLIQVDISQNERNELIKQAFVTILQQMNIYTENFDLLSYLPNLRSGSIWYKVNF